jgi:hypothetical protein
MLNSCSMFVICWALPPQAQGLSHWIQLLEVFTLLKLVSRFFLVKVFRLFRLEWIFLGVQSVDTVARCTTSYLSAGPGNLFVMPW